LDPGLPFGSKEWANFLLREGIKELKNKNRAVSGRFVEVLALISLLIDEGYWWQAERLRNHLYRHWQDLQPKADPQGREETSS
jgi:hypothetical protein